MRLPFGRPRDCSILPLAQRHSPALARLHREDFLRPWTDGEFTALLADKTVFGYAAFEIGNAKAGPVGFVLARLAAGEAEILTLPWPEPSPPRARLAVDGRGFARLHAQRAEALFLEVDETNLPAGALYRRLGFREVGKRPDYYTAADGRKSNALDHAPRLR